MRRFTPLKLASVLLVGIGSIVLVGWAFDVPLLKSILSGHATMKANIALAFMLVAAVLWLLRNQQTLSHNRNLALAGSLIVLLLGLLTLCEYLFGWNLGIDELLVRDADAATHPGRMAEATAFSLTLLGTALLLLVTSGRYWLIQGFALCVMGISLLALVGYLYGVETLYGAFAFSSIAFPTAAALLIASFAILLSRPNHGLMAVIHSKAAGGIVARRLLPAIVLVPLLLGWIRLQGQQLGLYDTEFGLALFALSNITVFALLLWWNAHLLNNSDTARRQSAAALLESENRYHRVLDDLLEGAQILSFDWRYLYVNDAAARHGSQPRESLLGHTIQERYPGIESSPVFAVMHRCMEKRTVELIENEFSYPDGSKAWFQLSMQPVPEGIFILSLDITERKQIEAEHKLYSRRMEILHEIDTGIISGSSIETVLTTAITCIRQIIPCQQVAVSLFDESTGEALLFAGESSAPSVYTLGQRYVVPPGFLDGLGDSRIRLIDDIQLRPELHANYKRAIADGMRSLLHILLYSQSKLIGFFVLNANTPDFFNAEYQGIAVEVANQLAIAVIQLRMSDELARHARELEQSLAEIQQAQTRYRSVVEDQTDLICRYDRDFRLTFVNRAYATSYGMLPQEMIGINFFDKIPEEDHEQAIAYVRSLSQDNPVGVSEHQSVMPDQTIRWFQWTDRAMFGDDGEVMEYQGVGRDITDRKLLQAEQEQHTRAVEEIQQFLRTTLDAFPAHTAVLAPDGTIIDINTAWKRFAEENEAHSTTHFLGSNYLEVCDRATGADAEEVALASAGIRAVIAGHQDDFLLEYACHSENEKRWFTMRVTPFTGPAPRRVVVAHINITERKRAEEAIQEANSNLELHVAERTEELQGQKNAPKQF